MTITTGKRCTTTVAQCVWGCMYIKGVKQMNRTRVIFRTNDFGEVVALFPELAGMEGHPNTMACFTDSGYGVCTEDVVQYSKPSKECEYQCLQEQLELRGHKLWIGKHLTRRARAMRQRELSA